MMKKLPLFAQTLAVALALIVCVPAPAHAYVDPSVVTYTIQAVAGVVVAISAVATVAIRRARKKINKTFNIDENAGKYTEGSIAKIDPQAADATSSYKQADEAAEELRTESAKGPEERGLQSLTWRKRFVISLLMSCFAFFTILIAPSIEVFGANTEALVFSLKYTWWITLLINGILAVICAFVLSSFRDKGFCAAMLFVFCVSVAAYVQALFMNNGMSAADGSYIDWNDWFIVSRVLGSGAVWLAILIIPQLASIGRRYAWLKATCALAICLFIVEGVGAGSVLGEALLAPWPEGGQPHVTQEALYTVNPKDNVIVFVLDSYDTANFKDTLKEAPRMLDAFTDFTFFSNSTGSMIPTHNAMPYILTAEKLQQNETMTQYKQRRYEDSDFLTTIHDQGYSLGIYTDSAGLDYRKKRDATLGAMTENITPMEKVPLDVWHTYLSMNQAALYRQAPWALKRTFWYYTGDMNNYMIDNFGEVGTAKALYELDDASIAKYLRTNGLAATDTGENGAFRLIHLFGPHWPYTLDENAEAVPSDQDGFRKQSIGSVKVVELYLEELKRLGLYDNATIIVTADHGVWTDRYDPIQQIVSPIMLVKPSMQTGSGSTWTESHMPISQEDLAPTILAAMGVEYARTGSGMSVWDVDDPARVRYYDALTSRGDNGRRIVEYQIVDDALLLKNWSRTGTEWYEAR